MSNRKFIWNIPNVLSLYRIASVPFVLYLIYSGKQQAFVILLSINLITDILDGFIARRFNMQTDLGAMLDSWADVGTYILAFAGLLKFEWSFVVAYKWGLGMFAGLYLLSFLVTYIKFGRICGLHLYSFKITGYLQGIFMLVLFSVGCIDWLFYLMTVIGCWANIEEIIIFLLLKEPRSNVKGVYWVLKNKQHV
ncbi:MAG: CDP-alcohol phosphatidyltransferase family protein [Bacteroidia bacterium]